MTVTILIGAPFDRVLASFQLRREVCCPIILRYSSAARVAIRRLRRTVGFSLEYLSTTLASSASETPMCTGSTNQRYMITRLLRLIGKYRWISSTSPLRLYPLWYQVAIITRLFFTNRLRCSPVGVLRCLTDNNSVMRAGCPPVRWINNRIFAPKVETLFKSRLTSLGGLPARWFALPSCWPPEPVTPGRKCRPASPDTLGFRGFGP